MDLPSSISRLFRPLLAALAVVLVCFQLVHESVVAPPGSFRAASGINMNDISVAATVMAATNTTSAKEYQELRNKVKRLEMELELKSKQGLVTAEERKQEQKNRLQTELKQKQEEQDSQEKSIQDDNKKVPRPNSCAAVVQRMHDWNDCWRRHMMNIDNITAHHHLLDQDISCPIHTQAGSNSTATSISERIGAPLYQYAYYRGQGFGRVVDHTVGACVIAFLLKRPCLINMSPRDPYHTWRTFLHENTYRWDPAVLHTRPNYADQLEDLAHKLPHIGVGEWKKAINISDYKYSKADNSTKPAPLVFPMDKMFDKEKYKANLQYYSGTNPTRGNQVLFSPNWADAWFTMIPTTEILRKEYGCESEQLQTMLQNALYGPTDLSWQLHQERYDRAVSTVWNTDKKVARNGSNAKDELAHRTRPHLSATISSTAQGMPSYGTIHMRTVMLNMGQTTPIDSKELAGMVSSCLKRASQLSKADDFPQNWWFLADNATMAAMVADEIQEKQQKEPAQIGASDDGLPSLKIFHDYDLVAAAERAKKSAKLVLSSKHSMNKEAIGLYGHAPMAGSIQDWMALHESTISIVNKDTAYGKTGARGNGKIPLAYCGAGQPDDKKQPFQILMGRQEERNK